MTSILPGEIHGQPSMQALPQPPKVLHSILLHKSIRIQMPICLLIMKVPCATMDMLKLEGHRASLAQQIGAALESQLQQAGSSASHQVGIDLDKSKCCCTYREHPYIHPRVQPVVWHICHNGFTAYSKVCKRVSADTAVTRLHSVSHQVQADCPFLCNGPAFCLHASNITRQKLELEICI